MRYLLFTVALLSAFYSYSAYDPDLGYDPDDLKAPRVETETVLTCTIRYADFRHETVTRDNCESLAMGFVNQEMQRLMVNQCSEFFSVEKSGEWTSTLGYIDLYRGKWNPEQASCEEDTTFRYNIRMSDHEDIVNKSCPPEQFPQYDIEVIVGQLAGGENDIRCARPQDSECPAGYHSKAVSAQLGSDECVPNNCPSQGTSETLYTSTNTGGDPFTQTGLYCSNGCAYEVQSLDDVYSPSTALAYSYGTSCGDKPYDEGFITPTDNMQNCTATPDANGVSVLNCPPADGVDPDNPDDPVDPVDNDNSKQPDEDRPDAPKENCAPDDPSCSTRNLEAELKNQINDLIENNNQRHNKMIDAITNNTNALNQSQSDTANAVNDAVTVLNITNQQQAARDNVQNELLGQIRDAINSGGGGGDGNGNGDGEGDDPVYNGECEGELCDFDMQSELESADTELTEWINEDIVAPPEINDITRNWERLVGEFFVGFKGACSGFTLPVTAGGKSFEIDVSAHCDPYETIFKPLLEWLIWGLTFTAIFTMASQTLRQFAHV